MLSCRGGGGGGDEGVRDGSSSGVCQGDGGEGGAEGKVEWLLHGRGELLYGGQGDSVSVRVGLCTECGAQGGLLRSLCCACEVMDMKTSNLPSNNNFYQMTCVQHSFTWDHLGMLQCSSLNGWNLHGFE